MIIAYNIGSNYSPLNVYPIIEEIDSFKGFKKDLREKDNIENLFEWAKANYVPPSKITLILRVRED